VFILDTSVAVKWFVDEPEFRDEADRALELLTERPSLFLVPELFFAEMLAVLGRALPAKGSSVVEAMTVLQEMGIPRLGHGREIIDRAAVWVQRHALGGYDAVYAACAESTGARWLTADDRALKVVKKVQPKLGIHLSELAG
jgi:predicted nucleic acid-binding protein